MPSQHPQQHVFQIPELKHIYPESHTNYLHFKNNNQVKTHKFFVMFAPFFWTQTSKPAKIGIYTICALDMSTIAHTHFLDQQHSLTFRRKKTCSIGITRKRGDFGYEFLDNPLVISKTIKEKDDSYKGHSIPPISFRIPEKSIFDN